MQYQLTQTLKEVKSERISATCMLHLRHKTLNREFNVMFPRNRSACVYALPKIWSAKIGSVERLCLPAGSLKMAEKEG